MDTEAEPGVYVWLKTTHVIGQENKIVDALECALGGEAQYFDLGYSDDAPETAASDELTRRVFVARINSELSDRAASSPVHIRQLGMMEGAVNASTNDYSRSNCRAQVLPHPPEGVTWVDA